MTCSRKLIGFICVTLYAACCFPTAATTTSSSTTTTTPATPATPPPTTTSTTTTPTTPPPTTTTPTTLTTRTAQSQQTNSTTPPAAAAQTANTTSHNVSESTLATSQSPSLSQSPIVTTPLATQTISSTNKSSSTSAVAVTQSNVTTTAPNRTATKPSPAPGQSKTTATATPNSTKAPDGSGSNSGSALSPTTTASPSKLLTTMNNLISKYSQTVAPSVASTVTTIRPLKYHTVAFNKGNVTCPFGYIPDTTIHVCVHLCENKDCRNDGQCYVDLGVNNATVAKCRCKDTSKYIYEGDNCETAEMSRGRERGITLGVLITMNSLFVLVIVFMCVKLKRGGNRLRTVQKSYDVNNL